MRQVFNLVATLLTVLFAGYSVGALIGDQYPILSMIIGFNIGFFGSKIIYGWLNKPDTPSI